MRVVEGGKVPIKIWASEIEEEAVRQLQDLATLPFLYKHVAVMPDAHAGKGSTVGTVIATKGAIIPAAVGVDISCGMTACKLPLKLESIKDLPKLRHSIERSVPTGHHTHKEVSAHAKKAYDELGELSNTAKRLLSPRVIEKAQLSLGTLGGGNHFIELAGDKAGQAWILLHSGSRNIGKCIADMHTRIAKDLMKQWFISLPHEDLAYLSQGTPQFDDYITDLFWAQRYAEANRKELLRLVYREVLYHQGLPYDDWVIADLTTEAIHCHHNYTSIEHHFNHNVFITRKGAISAKLGELGLIPGSMGAKSYIVRGLGSQESFCSASHGAGRRMSRTKAKNLYTKEDVEAQTQGVECRKNVVDEIPAAYKDIDQVMADQGDLVEPIYILKQVLCIKGD